MTLTARIVGTTQTAPVIPIPIPTVASISDLRNLAGDQATRPVVTLTHLTRGGTFAWDVQSVTDDGGTRFNAGGLTSTGPGWQRLFSGPLNAKWFGAKGDGQRATVTINGGDNFFTLSGLTVADVGKLFTLRDADTDGVNPTELSGTITNVVGNTVTLSVPAEQTATDKEFCWATDDTAALAAALAATQTSSTAELRIPRGIYGHTGLTFSNRIRVCGEATRTLNSIVDATHLRLMAPAARAYSVIAFESTFEDMVLDGGRLTQKVFDLQYLTANCVFRRLTIMGAVLTSTGSTSALVYIGGVNEVDVCNFERCVVVQNAESFADYCGRAFFIDGNTNAFNLTFEHGYVSNADILFHYIGGSMNVAHCQLFRWSIACFFINTACQQFEIRDCYNEGDTAPFFQNSLTVGVKNPAPIVIRECYINSTSPIITVCTQPLVLQNVLMAAGNISVEPAPVWGLFGVTSYNTQFQTSNGWIGSGNATHVSEIETEYAGFSTPVNHSRFARPIVEGYDTATDGPNSAVSQTGAGPAVTITGQPVDGYDAALIQISLGGARGTAKFNWSLDEGRTWEATDVVTAATVALGSTGLTANFPVGTYVLNEAYTWWSGLGGRHARCYTLASMTADRTYPLIPATQVGERLHLSVIGVGHSHTATITFAGATLIKLKNALGFNRWASFVYDTSVGWIPAAPTTDISATAIGTLIGSTVETSGTEFSTGPNTHLIMVRVWGGGGGGGGAASAAVSGAAAGGGGSGSYAEKQFTVTPDTAYSYAIGAGGAGGAAGNNPGKDGGNSTFTVGGTTVTAYGGKGGSGMAAGTTVAFAAGGAGGDQSTNGDVNGRGAPGGYGSLGTGLIGASGNGGSTSVGGGGVGVVAASSGNNGIGYGAGGGGALVLNASGAAAGGDGTDGMIVVDEYA